MPESHALSLLPPRHRADRLGWSVAALLLLAYGLPYSQPLFAMLFPALPRPVYLQEPMADLMWQHIGLVLVSSAVAVLLATLAGLATTTKTGQALRPMMETLAGMGQTFPPVAILAVAVPAVGFGELPALIALSIFGLLPVLQGTLAGLASVPTPVIDSARAMGMSPRHTLTEVQIPLAPPDLVGRRAHFRCREHRNSRHRLHRGGQDPRLAHHHRTFWV
jgi:ABC-type proline/glycine betaine transport systems, permease component